MEWTNLFWRRVFSLPQTYFLIVGVGLGYLAFVVWLGARPVALGIGGAIALVMLGAWFWKLKQMPSLTWINLLDKSTFRARLNQLESQLKRQSYKEWEKVKNLATETQEFAAKIISREPELMPELIETLYTVLSLCEQVTKSVLALQEIKTATYKEITEQYLQESKLRVVETYKQLEQLQDKVVISSLAKETGGVEAGLPQRLKILIADNKTALKPIVKSSSKAKKTNKKRR